MRHMLPMRFRRPDADAQLAGGLLKPCPGRLEGGPDFGGVLVRDERMHRQGEAAGVGGFRIGETPLGGHVEMQRPEYRPSGLDGHGFKPGYDLAGCGLS